LPEYTEEPGNLLDTHCGQSLHAQLISAFQLIHTHKATEEPQRHCTLIQTSSETYEEGLQTYPLQEVAGEGECLIFFNAEGAAAEVVNVCLLEEGRRHHEAHREGQFDQLRQEGKIGLLKSPNVIFEGSGELGIEGEFTASDLTGQECEVDVNKGLLALEDFGHLPSVLLPVNSLSLPALPLTLLLLFFRLPPC
jgi:hypothetical protein